MPSTLNNRLPRSQQGLSLIELMVAMTIGIVLVGGAFYVYATTRNAYNTNNSYAMMQENGRFALNFMEPDIQLAGFLGQHRTASAVENSALNRSVVLGGIANDCADNWVIQIDRYVEGTDGVAPNLACFPNNRYLAGTDTLTIRRAAPEPTITAQLNSGEIYIRSSESSNSKIFSGTTEPTGLPATALNYALRAHVYYVSNYTVGSPGTTEGSNDGIPSLRRVGLRNLGGTPTMIDEEVVPGVENFQVQYGYGPEGDSVGPNTIVGFVSNRNAVPAGSVVRAVRIWLLMRGEQDETGQGYIDDLEYELGDVEVTAPTGAEGFRRLVVSKTIFIRNGF